MASNAVGLFKAILPDEQANEFKAKRDLIAVISAKVKPYTEKADISELMRDVEKLLDRLSLLRVTRLGVFWRMKRGAIWTSARSTSTRQPNTSLTLGRGPLRQGLGTWLTRCLSTW
jgi:hypothetical protein